MRERLAPGRAAFDRGQFFDAHELWEELWRGLEGEERLLAQGLIQLAAGLHHAKGGRARPAARLVAKGAEKISRCASALRTEAEADALVAAAERLLAQLDR